MVLDDPEPRMSLPQIQNRESVKSKIDWGLLNKSFDFKRHLFPDDFDQDKAI